MKKISFISILLIICFISCDGRDRAYKSNTDNLEESKLSDTFFESIKYFPDAYSEIVTDTILSNGFLIKSKFFVDMNNNVLEEFKKDTIHYKHFYREFNVELSISNKENEIFSKLINKDFFAPYDFVNIDILDEGILLDFTIVDYNVTSVTFNFDYYPKAKDMLYRYKIIIKENGDFNVINEFVIF
jgi:hypothetical protein